MNHVKVNYLSNKEMLEEIYKTKLSFCWIENAKYARYDAIIHSIDEMFDEEVIRLAKETRAARIANDAYQKDLNVFKSKQSDVNDQRAKQNPNSKPVTLSGKPKADSYKIDPDTYTDNDLVFRYVTWDHIPTEDGRKKNPKKTADLHAKLNFIPFKHLIITDKAARKYKEVVISHWKNGEFNLEAGKITNELANMFLLLVNRYAQRSNWRGYTYVEEMKGQALLQLSVTGLLFDEYKSENPFSYFTAIVSNSFTSILNGEKKHQSLRDDLLQEYGKNPSYTRQAEHEGEMRKLREDLDSQANTDQ